MDADDFTRCVGCDCSLCLIDHSYYIECATCNSDVCFGCLEKAGAVKNLYYTKEWSSIKHSKEFLEPEDFIEPYEWVEDEEFELGWINKCPYCDEVLGAFDKEKFINWLCHNIGRSRKELEDDFRMMSK